MIGKLLAAAKRKWGPLPVWVWAGIAGTAGALWWRMRGGGDTTTGAAIAEPSYAYGGEADYGDTGSTPAVDAGGDMSGDRLGVDAARIQQLEDALSVVEKGMANTGEHLNDPAYWGVDTEAGSSSAPESGVDAGGTDVVDPAKPDDNDAAKPKPKAKGVLWGGRTFTTKQSLGSWLSAHGANYATWAKRHPAAAKLLKGPVPKPKPPARRPAPKPASPRAPSRRAPVTGKGQGGARTRTPPRPKPKPVAKRRPAPRVSVRPQTKTPVATKKKAKRR